jgi:hypothetical protein
MKRTIIIFFSILTSCQNKKETMTMNTNTEPPIFQWEESVSSPKGFPIDVYEGGLVDDVGSITPMNTGTSGGPWGGAGRSMSGGLKKLPVKLDVIWKSYIEDKMYHCTEKIDYNKLLEYFKKGYSYLSNDKKREIKETFDEIKVGFAPGGVIIVWVSGITCQYEIGRYQSEETKISKEEIASLDLHDRLMFDDVYIKESILENEKIVPLELQKRNKNEPIPFGLWDLYRQRFNWKYSLTGNHNVELTEYISWYINGEIEDYDVLLHKKIDKKSFALPLSISFAYKDKDLNQDFGAKVKFDENQISRLIENFKKNKINDFDIQIQVNMANSYSQVFVIAENYKQELKTIENVIY